MREVAAMILPLLFGILLGTIFFGGLWWTIQRGVSSKRPALVFSSSLLLRTATTVAGFYFIARDNWRNLLACLFGFLLARLLVTRYLSTPAATQPPMLAGGGR